MPKRPSSGGLVYSTDAGRMCPGCRQPIAQCTCKAAVAPPTDGVVRVFLETKGRGGKGVTVVRGLGLADPELAAQEQLEIPVQVNGKLRSRVFAAPDVTEADLRAAALADEKVKAIIEGQQVVKVIIVPQRLVNIVAR